MSDERNVLDIPEFRPGSTNRLTLFPFSMEDSRAGNHAHFICLYVGYLENQIHGDSCRYERSHGDSSDGGLSCRKSA